MSSSWSAKSTTDLKRLVFTSLKPPTELASMLRVSVQNEGELPPEQPHRAGPSIHPIPAPGSSASPQPHLTCPNLCSHRARIHCCGNCQSRLITVGSTTSASGLQQSHCKAPRKRRLEKWKPQCSGNTGEEAGGHLKAFQCSHCVTSPALQTSPEASNMEHCSV